MKNQSSLSSPIFTPIFTLASVYLLIAYPLKVKIVNSFSIKNKLKTNTNNRIRINKKSFPIQSSLSSPFGCKLLVYMQFTRVKMSVRLVKIGEIQVWL